MPAVLLIIILAVVLFIVSVKPNKKNEQKRNDCKI